MRRGEVAQRWRIGLLALLWLGHGVWVLRGRPSAHWISARTAALTHPLLGFSGRWEAWRAQKAQQARDLGTAQRNLQALAGEVDRLRLQQAENGPLFAEAREATRLLGLKQQLPLELKAARILANLRQAPFGGFVLDQGADGGLVQDQGVIAPEGVVGRIWQVGARQSTVLPLDAFNSSTSVMLARSRATGVLQGTSRGRAEIRYISSQEIVQPGEAVYTSGMDGVFPRGLLVGTVAAVRPRDIELGVEVSLAAPLDRVPLVLILPSQPPMELQLPAQPPSLGKPGGVSK